MNKFFVILICVILICVIGIFIYKKYSVFTYDANSEYKINITTNNKSSYIIWFNIESWKNGKKILFKKTTDGKDDFIVFIGDLTNILYIYLEQNNKIIDGTPIMLSYNGCTTDITPKTPETEAVCKTSCMNKIDCSGFAFNDGSCYSFNSDNLFTSNPGCPILPLQLKLIEVKKHIPLQTLVKVAITFNNENMIVYINDELISTYYLTPIQTSSSIITVTPSGYGFTGYTYFKYINKCLNYREIKVLR